MEKRVHLDLNKIKEVKRENFPDEMAQKIRQLNLKEEKRIINDKDEEIEKLKIEMIDLK